MTLDSIIELLKKSGVNSKKQVIELLQTKNTNELYELVRSVNTRIAELNVEKGKNK